ncbi:MAG TPA: lysoplasmalogenase [Noviherbaspirillum sp.]
MPDNNTNHKHRATGNRQVPGSLLALLTASSGALCIAAGTGLLASWLTFVFKPLTTILIIAYAWKRGHDLPAQRRLILAGLVLSLAGDVFLLWPKEGFLFGLVSFLLAHLLYILAFCIPAPFAARPAFFVGYALVAAGILSQLWNAVPPALRIPVVAYVVFLATMAAQAAGWWRSAPAGSRAGWAAAGGLLFMASDTLLAFNKFATPLPLAPLWILATYWTAQWCIASAMTRAA